MGRRFFIWKLAVDRDGIFPGDSRLKTILAGKKEKKKAICGWIVDQLISFAAYYCKKRERVWVRKFQRINFSGNFIPKTKFPKTEGSNEKSHFPIDLRRHRSAIVGAGITERKSQFRCH
jgi:hypothetical protein